MNDMMEIPNAVVTPTSLVIKDGIPFDSWKTIGHQLGQVNQGLLWWIGDWLNYGEKAYGESYAQAMDETGKAYNTVKQAAYMAKKFPQETRRDTLTFSHYGVVAGLPDDLCIRLLDLAEDNKWTVGDLKEKRKEMENKQDVITEKQKLVTCPACGHEFELS